MGTSIVDWAEAGDTMWVIEPTGKFCRCMIHRGNVSSWPAARGNAFRGFVREAASDS